MVLHTIHDRPDMVQNPKILMNYMAGTKLRLRRKELHLHLLHLYKIWKESWWADNVSCDVKGLGFEGALSQEAPD